MPDVSIVMITWAATKRRLTILGRSMDSLKAHTTMPHTLIVVDNGPESQSEYLKTQDIDLRLQPKYNIGIGAARNWGASATESEYIAFVDNDIQYHQAWLRMCVHCLERNPGKLIATPILSAPMSKHPQNKQSMVGIYEKWSRSSPQAWVMRRSDFLAVGPWKTHSQPGTDYCDRLRFKGYSFLWHPSWTSKHLDKRASYNHKNRLVKGEWQKKPGHVYWRGEWINRKKESKKCQSNAV